MIEEIFISVDIEADGPIPGDYSMLSLGACVVDSIVMRPSFYVTFQPISEQFDPEALSISGLNRGKLLLYGEDPDFGMHKFRKWIDEVAYKKQPVFVGFNAAFDWMFVCWYFEHFLGKDTNPFGHSALDIKAYYAGVTGKRFWRETSMEEIKKEFPSKLEHTHNALADAREQAEIFRKIREKASADHKFR